MNRYRLSKYNPKYRDEYGNYTRQEWTAISDIDEIGVFSQEYLNVENNYIKAIIIILEYFEIEKLYVMQLEKDDNVLSDNEIIKEYGQYFSQEMRECILCVQEGEELSKEKIEDVLKLTLREVIWCVLYSRTTHFVIKPGFDFYINIICMELPKKVIEEINKLEIFIEEV